MSSLSLQDIVEEFTDNQSDFIGDFVDSIAESDAPADVKDKVREAVAKIAFALNDLDLIDYRTQAEIDRADAEAYRRLMQSKDCILECIWEAGRRKKITAVKAHRVIEGSSLVEAKNWVEQLHNPVRQEWEPQQ